MSELRYLLAFTIGYGFGLMSTADTPPQVIAGFLMILGSLLVLALIGPRSSPEPISSGQNQHETVRADSEPASPDPEDWWKNGQSAPY